ncbi:hypothetical protein [Hymenobacter rubripertinctus]|uniref:Uncharacterized protein n=1 Tax=Hymenobacter rubripertinctus TaxID=2029981 RepID=A0A418R8A8_9BACT|nr:hypothetical protein [Hymenobacter rubripertinctus]RIY13768.1 hypothetical protein D0T11_01420 [Hymenobacter rubripertinctus]
MATATKTNPAAAKAAPAAAAETLTPTRAYLTATLDEDSGEVIETPMFRYLPGHPRQVRFDAKAGQFNVGGITPLGPKLAFIPVALRIFEDDILNMGRKTWAELFFVDAGGAVCAVLFHGYSVENLQKLNAELFYDDLRLVDVVLTVKATKKENKKVGGTYYIAEFEYVPAAEAEVAARQQFAEDFPLFREETLTGTADLRIVQGYRLPEGREPQPQPAQLAAAEVVSQ